MSEAGRDKHANKWLNAGRGTVGNTAVVGTKDRETNQVQAQVVEDTIAGTLQEFVTNSTKEVAQVYTGDSRS